MNEWMRGLKALLRNLNAVEVVRYLRGKKTHVIALLVACVALAYAVGWIDQSTFATLATMLGALGLSAIRAGVEKLKTGD